MSLLNIKGYKTARCRAMLKIKGRKNQRHRAMTCKAAQKRSRKEKEKLYMDDVLDLSEF